MFGTRTQDDTMSTTATRSWTEGPMLGFDLETTGVDVESDVMVSFAFLQMQGNRVLGSTKSVVDPGREISTEASAVHGITTERARTEGIAPDAALALIVNKLLSASNSGLPVVGMNLRYDLTIIDRASRRAGGQGLAEMGFVGPVVDVLVIDRHFDPWRKGHRTLTALTEHYGVEGGPAHDAAGDALSTLRVARHLGECFDVLRAMSLTDLHEAQIAWHRDWAKAYSAWRVKHDKPGLPPSEWIWPIPPLPGSTVVPYPSDTPAPSTATNASLGMSEGTAIGSPPLACRGCSRPTIRRDEAGSAWCLVCQADALLARASRAETPQRKQEDASSPPTRPSIVHKPRKDRHQEKVEAISLF